jgi:exodeoxyribonuclease VII large subunit
MPGPDFLPQEVAPLALSELQELIKDGVESACPGKVWVQAEIASVSVKANGHCYLDLVENADGNVLARARAVVWSSRYRFLRPYLLEALGSDLQVGMQILSRVQVSYSGIYSLTLVIDEIEPEFTIGAVELERRRTIEKLEKEGLLDAQKALSLPDLPYALAVISASTAAGYGDFVRHLEGNAYGFAFGVQLFEAAMQGENAPGSIADALQRVETSGKSFDAVLILRGGGSAGDLSCFDDYGLCFAIASCPIPVFTAIGHERDRHIADMVAFCAVKTPTALADEFIDAFAAEDEHLLSALSSLRLSALSRLSAEEQRLRAIEERIAASDPKKVLERGYSLVTDASGVVLKRAEGIAEGSEIEVLFRDGRLKCLVKTKI